MNTEFYAFGEILWDCLPSGRHAGGAPFNVAAHLAQLGASVSLISAVGRDPLGDEILKVAEDKRGRYAVCGPGAARSGHRDGAGHP
jgi:fructokinase